MDYRKNQKYFEKVSYTGAIICITVGVIFILMAPLMSGLAWFGIFVAIGGGIFVYVKRNGIVTDEEYDSGVQSMLNDMESKALSKLGIDEDEVKEIKPITMEAYTFKGASKAKEGKDGLWRSNKFEYVALFFSSNEVHCYTYVLDTTSANKKPQELTDVYFYKDIVSVSTNSEAFQVGASTINSECFKLVTAGGTALEVPIDYAGEDIQRSINAMRGLLRAKKQA